MIRQEEKTNQIFNGDCLTELDKVQDKSVQLVLIDPPYNIGKDQWDNFGIVKKGYQNHRESYTGESYYDFMEKVFIKLESKLKDNGSFFFFHNDFRIMSKLDLIIDEKTKLIQRNFLVWNKRFDSAKKKGFLDGFVVKGGLTCFNKMAEYMLFYTFDNSWKLRQKRLELNINQSTIAKEIKSKTGKVTGWYSNLETGGFVRSNDMVDYPNIQYHFFPSLVLDHGRQSPSSHSFQAHVGPMRPTSRGHVKLKSNNPSASPAIQFNYMQTEHDLKEMRDGIKIAREIFHQKAFDKYRGKEINPGINSSAESDLNEFIKNKGDTAYHPSCTCKMGKDELSVVDEELKVYGIENLRVVDASIMPNIITGNLNATTVMIAEKASDLILKKETLPDVETSFYRAS